MMKYKTISIGSDGGLVGFRPGKVGENEIPGLDQPVFDKTWAEKLERIEIDYPGWELFQLVSSGYGLTAVLRKRESGLVDPSRAQPEKEW